MTPSTGLMTMTEKWVILGNWNEDDLDTQGAVGRCGIVTIAAPAAFVLQVTRLLRERKAPSVITEAIGHRYLLPRAWLEEQYEFASETPIFYTLFQQVKSATGPSEKYDLIFLQLKIVPSIAPEVTQEAVDYFTRDKDDA